MLNVTCVTTLTGPKQYGQRFIDRLSKQVDPKIKLIVHAEKCHHSNDPKNRTRDADNTLTDLQTSQTHLERCAQSNGKCPSISKTQEIIKEFKWDAVRFANKVYAVFETAKDPKH